MEILIQINKFYYPRCMAMKMWENFFKKINKPVPVFAQTTKMEKEISSEDSSSSKPKTTFCDVAGLEEV